MYETSDEQSFRTNSNSSLGLIALQYDVRGDKGLADNLRPVCILTTHNASLYTHDHDTLKRANLRLS